MVHLIVSNRHWNENMPARVSSATGHQFHYIGNKDDFTLDKIRKLCPRYIFLPHWSYIIPSDIYDNFECVVFHMTDLPFGRGGSPLQNLIASGIYETKISALRCEKNIDAGPVYLKENLSLYGDAEEIYLRAGKIIEKMIAEIALNNPQPSPQEGDIACFERRRPSDGDISSLRNLDEVFDYIRMLDADGYPKAFLETRNLRFEFQRSSLKHGKVIADVCITVREDHE